MDINGFDWDKHNKEKIFEKHKITVDQVEQIFFNKPLLIFTDIKHSVTEKRYFAFGNTDTDIPLTVIFTYRLKKEKKLLRPISARKMNRKERKIYNEKKITEI